MNQVFVGLGGNIGDASRTLNEALTRLKTHREICNLRCSSFYRTTPVSAIPQDDYINAVCSFDTVFPPYEVMNFLQKIERELGKVPKPKEAPRPIDLDILFYGKEKIQTSTLTIPHPRWRERLFVLVPLKELVDQIEIDGQIIDLQNELQIFRNIHRETVSLMKRR